MKMAIDLLWVRPKQVGGIESYIRNLLDAFLESDYPFQAILIVSKDNNETFKKYYADERFTECIANVYSCNVKKRILWQNFHLSHLLKKLAVDFCFEPYYCKPLLGSNKVKFVTTIHDLQALHYPQYFSKFKNLWMRISWKHAIKSSRAVVAISQYVKGDIEKQYPKISKGKIYAIYNPIVLNYHEQSEQGIFSKLGIKEKEYFYTVSSLLPHKNLTTLIKALAYLNKHYPGLPDTLVISGIGGKSKAEIEKLSKAYNVKLILTGFVSNDERNALYKGCSIFLFSSLFEGFGMPPVEAMMLGTKVISTKSTSLYEVTQGKCLYVDDPLDEKEWAEKIVSCNRNSISYEGFAPEVYSKHVVVKDYFHLFSIAVMNDNVK